jgi:Methylamine utilisation protein MauE
MTNVCGYPLASVAAATFTALLFGCAALHKASDFDSFTGFVMNYQVISPNLVVSLSSMVIAAEGIVPITLLFRHGREFGAILAAALLLGYATVIAINLLRGRSQIDCGCGGARQPLAWSLVARNVVLAAIAALIALPSLIDATLWEAAAAMGGGAVVWAIYVVAEGVLSDQTRMRVLMTERN